ncbi:MAG: glycosyltransferase family A protein [Elusimicrobia bacterium]|jgi:glycosyltransferase involved in cell wall biosynthesis|nr:glycosyltransferase family A protein [Elusimicrobiota bacterium]
MPKVSINLCCYNSEPFLEETLASAFAQTCADYELVIVNDGSRDGTDAMIRRHIAQGRPIVYHPQDNAGLGAARNKALELSSGEFIAILDHDDVWEPRKLEKQLPLFDRPEVGFAGSDALLMDASGRPLSLCSRRNPLRRGRVLPELLLYNFIPCAAAVMRKSAIVRAGGFFRPEFRIAEEYELFLRLAAVSEFDFIPEPLVRIRVHPASAGWDFDRERAETCQALEECLQREPRLGQELGPKVLTVKRAGLWLSPEAADALRGRPAPWKTRARAAALYGLACLGPGAADLLRRWNRALRRRAAALTGGDLN